MSENTSSDRMTSQQPSDYASDLSRHWSEAGALVIRKHESGLDRGQYERQGALELGPPEPAELDPADIAHAFVTLVPALAGRMRHMPLGLTVSIFDAMVGNAVGDYALCLAADPNCVLWSRASKALLSNIIYLIQHDPEALHTHEQEPDEARASGTFPSFEPIDVARYNADLKQTDPRWLPLCWCAAAAGMGLYTGNPEDYGLRRMASAGGRTSGRSGLSALLAALGLVPTDTSHANGDRGPAPSSNHQA